ncbi:MULTISPECIES: MmpS family transport accessory protein [unclassified Rothia (in: high G+C Gram-positive bacteria)]|uniref:MmpS family transport accessory protein n=1 Tax=unclassified Rothia (in: high G+C Gram-positive bacteria) TaxID=2689056 RepID=UPI00195787E9|nr:MULTISPECIES: MmpS family transport accessory protein [unclassified Rothia (in: high G+C Gram-positive bacteria)]MBM7050601.1 hypothetical protein [Rothia sp. ZJ1223]QRZ60796.1 hypothetical protein JR346_05735 [Rothia sp. ZJ932]
MSNTPHSNNNEHVAHGTSATERTNGSYAPEEKKKSIWPWLLGLLALLLLIGGCSLLTSNNDNEEENAETTEVEKTVDLELSVTADGAAAVNHGPSDAKSADNAIENEWSTTIENIHPENGYSMTVTGKGETTANLACKIVVDGVVQDEQFSADENKITCTLPSEIKK